MSKYNKVDTDEKPLDRTKVDENVQNFSRESHMHSKFSKAV